MPEIPINPVRYPTLYRYLSGLPQGIDSYPDIQSTAEVAASIRATFGAELLRDDLPDYVKTAMAGVWHKTDWIPEVHFMTLNALVRDIVCRNDEKYYQFCFDTMKAAFSSPLMRSLMYVMSPSVLALATEKRWGKFKRGSVMKTIQSTSDGRVLQLTYPEKLYLDCMLGGFMKSIEAACRCTRVTSTEIEMKIISPTETHFTISWSI